MPIKAGTDVRIESRLDDFSGTVRYCRADGKEFLIGVQCDTPGKPAGRSSLRSSPKCSLNRAEREQQRKQVEAEWARKAEEIVQIQAEMENIKALYTARISRNTEGVARQKATFAGRVSSKQQERQGMAEAVELCSKSHLSTVSSPSSAVSLVKVNAKMV